jgi:hypothetical protein
MEKTIFFNVFGRLYASNVKLNPMFNVGQGILYTNIAMMF